MKGVASFWKSLSCFSISHLRHRFCLVSSSSLFLIPFHSGMSGTHMGHSGDQGLLLIFVWCCGRTIVHVEVLFVIHSLRELHFTSTYISAFLELLSFFWQTLVFFFPWQENMKHYLPWINLFDGALLTFTCNWYYFDFQYAIKHIVLSFFFSFPLDISLNEELSSAWRNLELST